MDNTTPNKPVKTIHGEREEKILAFWKEKDIFKKTLSKPSPKGEYIFYDGPPFANGLPHYGHILASVIKDVVPRWRTMQGYHVPRKWGWDCHGLPVENLIEKELNLKSKKDIVTYGVGKFNEAAKESVMRYADEWRKVVPRMGRFVDMENDYRTMDATYTESVWWSFKTLHDKGLVYEGFKSMNICPRCETTLSNFEVAQGYKDITDISVIAKFKVKSSKILNKGEEASFLAWTTTPWTLPGNVALAVNPMIDYVEVKIDGDKEANKNGFYILAKDRLSALKDSKYEVINTVKGAELVGATYEPLFDYYSKNEKLKNRANGWKVYSADFVTTEDGTGIVHIAPAFGADDYSLLEKNNLPFVQHVTTDGRFKDEVSDFAGMPVKPIDTKEEKDAHQKADIEIIKWLAHHGSLFAKEKLIHSYPHCWRCDTPLLNYAASSWFVKVTAIKDKLVKENKKVSWVPPEVGEGRFGNWLMGARDWAISRTRFWGAPIPVWREEGSHRIHVMGSVEDLKQFSKPRNTYYVMRHGQAENNTAGVLDASLDSKYHLTEKGRKQAEEAAKNFKGKIDLIVTSPILRTVETAKIFAKVNGINEKAVITDAQIKEYNAGIFDGKSVAELGKACGNTDRFIWKPEGGEDYQDIKKRMGDFLYKIEREHFGKNILIVTHETPALLLFMAASGAMPKDCNTFRPTGDFMVNAEIRKLDFSPIPHNERYELDLHRPFIDEVELKTADGKKLTRVPDVFDCWYESGSMPYASNHYPFKKGSAFDPKSGIFKRSKGFPADFIAEGLDQTRGWFYSMMVLGVALFGKSPYKKVIVNGLILAEDGEKMSKRKQNYPDPMGLVDKYGADSLRYYLLSSPVVHSQDLCFSEKGVDEVTKKIVNRLLNVVSFYEMYAPQDNKSDESEASASKNILDLWVISRLNETIDVVTSSLEAGELDRSARPFMDLVDDISTWYLRRSRDRFKGEDVNDKASALSTTKLLILSVSKLMAPFMPFLAEDIYQRVGGSMESVHLENWPQAGGVDRGLLDAMKLARTLSSLGLEARMKAKINVRQPLASLKVKQDEKVISSGVFGNELVELIKDEVNVKNVSFGAGISSDAELDTVITPELKEEGIVRELIRAIQDLRKEKKLTVKDLAILAVETNGDGRKIIDTNSDKLKLITMVKEIRYETVNREEVKIADISFKLDIK